MGLGDLMNAAKAVNLTDEQKKTIKEVVKQASGNKQMIAAELKKHNIPVTEEQIDMVVKMIENF